MLIEIEMKIPGSTKQQRKISGKKSYPTMGLRVARATWQAALEPHAPEKPLAGAVAMEIVLNYHNPSKKRTFYKTTRPDLDNLAKIIIDALVTTGYMMNDAQVVELKLAKYYTSTAERVTIEIEELE